MDTTSRRILLVEHAVIHQRNISAMLKERGDSATIAANADEALAALRRAEFDVVLFDLLMPSMNCFAALQAVRRAERATGRGVWTIALTPDAIPGDRERCLAIGFDDHLAKPITSDSLGAAIKRAPAAPPNRSDNGKSKCPVMDRDAVIERFDGDRAFIADMAALFVNNDCPHLLEEIRMAVERGDGPRLYAAAHSLKNWVGNFSAPEVFESVRLVEETGRSSDFQASASASEGLRRQLDRLCAEMKDLLFSPELAPACSDTNELDPSMEIQPCIP